MTMENRCIICDTTIPEGNHVCPNCAKKVTQNDRNLIKAFPDYPCASCKSKFKIRCMCEKWKDWFSLHWNRFRSYCK